jgi:hypothetical protein
MVERVVYLGATSQVIVRLPFDQSLQVMVPNQGGDERLAAGDRVAALIPPDALRVLRRDSEDVIDLRD